MNKPKRPVALIIRDGWGINPNPEGNAVFQALTPNIDRYLARYPWTRLACSGEPVGLPEGYQGSSEVGHLNIGAGRIVIQELKRIDDGLSGGQLFTQQKWQNLITHWRDKGGVLHLLGLLQDEGVHAHMEHLFKIMRRARSENPEGRILIHPFLDGRDTAPRSSLEYLGRLEQEMAEIGNCEIGTVMGRYYSMDRSRNYRLTDLAYACLVGALGRHATDAKEAVLYSYDNDKTPDGVEMFDEYIPCHTIGDFKGIQDGDCVMHTNYRQDRAIQLTQAFVADDYPGDRAQRPTITYLGFTRYWDEFEDYLLGAMDAEGDMDKLLGEVVSAAGLKQLRIAETQKYRHVTSFFNGKSTVPYPGEDDVDVPSTFDPSSFGSHPQMDAENVTIELLKRLDNNPYDLIVVNYANGDMVGHTGSLEAATKAIEVVDGCIGRVVERLLELDAHILITADHGNSEQMVDYVTGNPKTSHTLNEVEFIYVANDSFRSKLLPSGKLSDIAPTILELLGLPQPAEMTSVSLIDKS